MPRRGERRLRSATRTTARSRGLVSATRLPMVVSSVVAIAFRVAMVGLNWSRSSWLSALTLTPTFSATWPRVSLRFNLEARMRSPRLAARGMGARYPARLKKSSGTETGRDRGARGNRLRYAAGHGASEAGPGHDDARDQHLLARAHPAGLLPAAAGRGRDRGVHQHPARRLPRRGAPRGGRHRGAGGGRGAPFRLRGEGGLRGHGGGHRGRGA